MSNNKDRTTSAWKLVLLLVLPVIAITAITVVAIRTSRRQQDPALLAPLVGTWQAEDGDAQGGYTLFDLRADGTARFRSSTGEPLNDAGETVGYFEWTVDESGRFEMFLFSSKGAAWKGRVHRLVMELTPTDVYQLRTISPMQFELRSNDSDTVTTLTRTHDAQLEAAP